MWGGGGGRRGIKEWEKMVNESGDASACKKWLPLPSIQLCGDIFCVQTLRNTINVHLWIHKVIRRKAIFASI